MAALRSAYAKFAAAVLIDVDGIPARAVRAGEWLDENRQDRHLAYIVLYPKVPFPVQNLITRQLNQVGSGIYSSSCSGRFDCFVVVVRRMPFVLVGVLQPPALE